MSTFFCFCFSGGVGFKENKNKLLWSALFCFINLCASVLWRRCGVFKRNKKRLLRSAGVCLFFLNPGRKNSRGVFSPVGGVDVGGKGETPPGLGVEAGVAAAGHLLKKYLALSWEGEVGHCRNGASDHKSLDHWVEEAMGHLQCFAGIHMVCRKWGKCKARDAGIGKWVFG